MDIRRLARIAPSIVLTLVVTGCTPALAPVMSGPVTPARSAGPSASVVDGAGAERLAAAWIAERHGIDTALVRFDRQGSRDRLWFAKVVAPASIAVVIVWVDLDSGEIGEGDPFGAPDPTPQPLLRGVDRALLDALDADELVNAWATAQSERAADLARAARALGMDVDAQWDDELLVIGTPGAVRGLLTLDSLSILRLEERRDAGRPVAEIAVASLDRPGSPYIDAPFARTSVRTSGEPIPTGGVDVLLEALRPMVPTVDGKPYEELSIRIDCEGRPATCRIGVAGGWRWSGGLDGPVDALAFVASASDGWALHPAPEPTLTAHGALPRSLVRQAERIAREDPAAGPAILATERLRWWRWFPSRPGAVELTYEGTRVLAAGLGGLSASMGLPERQLVVEVDVFRGGVTSVVEVPAPG